MRKEEKKGGKFPGATRWPHDTIFLLVKVAIRAAVVSLYNANAASVHNVATQRDCGRGVQRAPFTGNNIYNIHIYNARTPYNIIYTFYPTRSCRAR